MARLNTNTNIGLQYANPFDNISKWIKQSDERDLLQKKLDIENENRQYQKNRDLITDQRWDIQNARIEEEYARKKKEQQSADSFYNSMAEGTKAVGGLYGDVLAKNASPYELTQAEIASGIIDPAKARASGNEALAKKLEWQIDAGETANKAVTADAFKESRPEMYLRIMDESRAKGLPVLPGMVEKYESAKLAEETASAKKLEDVTKLKEDIYKDQLSNQWKLVGATPPPNGSVQSGVDSEGNPIYIPTLKQQVNAQNKANKTFDEKMTSGTSLINSTLSDYEDKNKVTFKDEQKIAITDQMNKLFRDEVAKNPNIDPDLISQAVSEAANKKDAGLIFTDNQPSIDMKKFEADVKNSILNKSMSEKIKSQQQVELQNSGSDGNMPSKFDMAKELVSGTNAINANRLAGINSKMSQLNMTPEERRIAKAQEWLKSEGLGSQDSGSNDAVVNRLANINKELTDPKKSISGVPDSLRVSEGIVNKAYGDSGGYAVGMGYNLTQNKDSIQSDFEKANIPKDKILIARTRPQDLVLDDSEAQRLAQVATFDRMDRLDSMLKGSGKTFDTLSPAMQPIALQMMYRGDLGNTEYGTQLKNLIKKDDVNGLVNYVANNADKLPKEVVTRLENNLRYDKGESLSRGTMTDNQKNTYLETRRNPASVKIEDQIQYQGNEKFKEPDRIGDLLSQKKNILKSDISLDEKEKEISKINLELKNSTKQDVGFLENTSSKLNNIIKGKPASINPLLQPITSSIDFMISSGVRDVNFVKDNIAIPLGNLLKEKSLTIDEKNEIQKIMEDLLPNKKFMESITPKVEGRTDFSNVSEESKQLSNYFANPYPNDFDKSLVSDLYRNVNLYRLK